MANGWKAGAGLADDVRHTFERTVYGLQTTGDITTANVPGIHDAPVPEASPRGIHGPASDSPTGTAGADFYGRDTPLAERQVTASAYEHATPGVRAEIDSVEGRPYRHGDAPDLQSRGSTFGPQHGPTPGAAPGAASGAVQAGPEPASAAPEAASAPAPSAAPTNDLTPG